MLKDERDFDNNGVVVKLDGPNSGIVFELVEEAVDGAGAGLCTLATR